MWFLLSGCLNQVLQKACGLSGQNSNTKASGTCIHNVISAFSLFQETQGLYQKKKVVTRSFSNFHLHTRQNKYSQTLSAYGCEQDITNIVQLRIARGMHLFPMRTPSILVKSSDYVWKSLRTALPTLSQVCALQRLSLFLTRYLVCMLSVA